MPPKIVLIGDFMVDEYIYCDANRLSPEAPVPVAEFRKRELKPGGAGNLLANLLSMEVPIDTVIGSWGNGCYGQVLHELVERVPNFIHLANETGKTTVKQRIIGQGRHLLRVDYYDRCDPIFDDYAADETVVAVKDADFVIVSDYGKGTVFRDIYRLMAGNAKIIVDPHPDHSGWYTHRWLVKANDKETERISLKLGKEYLDETPVWVETYGVKGASIGSRILNDGFPYHIPQRNVVDHGDPTGAGDVFMAAMIKAIVDGHDIPKAVQIANLVAAESVKTFGTVVMGIDVYRKAEGEVCR